MNKKKKEINFKKHSAIIQISNIINAQQRKIFNTLIYNSSKKINEFNNGYFTIEINNLEKLSGYKSTNKKRIKEYIKELCNIKVEFNILNKDKKKWTYFSLLSEVNIIKKTLYYSFPPSIMRTIKHPSIYAILDLIIIKGFNSKYSIALYEITKDYINAEIPKMEIKKFKELMGIKENQYTQYPDLKKRVIDPAIKEITNNTNINLTYEIIKEGRIPKYIKFEINEKTLDFNHNKYNKKLLTTEAIKCFQKSYGHCKADWNKYKEKKDVACHYCSKFNNIIKAASVC